MKRICVNLTKGVIPSCAKITSERPFGRDFRLHLDGIFNKLFMYANKAYLADTHVSLGGP